MNDDELVERLQRALRTEADTLTPGQGTPRVTPVSARRRRRLSARNGGYVVLALAAVIAASVTIAVGLRPHQTHVGVQTSSPTLPRSDGNAAAVANRPPAGSNAKTPAVHHPVATTTPTAPPTTTPTTYPPATTPPQVPTVAADFVPLSASFVSVYQGWVLGIQGCQATSACLRLDTTTDRGAHWQAEDGPAISGLSMPAGAARPDLQVRFSSASVGWIYGTVGGAAVLYSTDNGGAQWVNQGLPAKFGATGIEDIETANSRVQLVFVSSDGIGIASAAAAPGPLNWTLAAIGQPAGTPTATSAQLVVQHAGGWVVEMDQGAVVGGARIVNGTWQSWTPSCTRAGQAGEPVLLAAATASNLVAVCGPAGQQHLEVSANGGRTFSDEGQISAAYDVTSVSSASPSSAVLGTSSGSIIETATATSGANFNQAYANAGGQPIVQTGFEDGTHGIMITSTGSGGAFYTTSDAGSSWTQMDLQQG